MGKNKWELSVAYPWRGYLSTGSTLNICNYLQTHHTYMYQHFGKMHKNVIEILSKCNISCDTYSCCYICV